ncbi:amidohydrolase [Dehalococcoidia bacterium]|nr:amidohydrolase [Dehalococcoidia bacterium]
MKYKVISTDDHLQEAPDTWTSRMSEKKWGDKIPQIKTLDDGTDNWFIYGEQNHIGRGRVARVDGAMPDRTTTVDRWELVPQSTYLASERIKAMDQDGVDAHTFFGNIAGVAGNTFSAPRLPDEEFRLECIQAFNDHQIENFSDQFPGRFITLAITPLWSVEAAVGELNRTKGKGIHGLSYCFPQQFGYPHFADQYWGPYFAAAQEANLSVNLHIGSGGSMGVMSPPAGGTREQGAAAEAQRLGTNPDAHPLMALAEGSTKSISANTQVMATVLFSGVLERFPNLKIVSSESGLGWVPYLLETADHQWERQKLSRIGMSLKPSEYFHRQCYVNFWYEVIGIKMRDHIGIDNIMWESDFPHPTCTWPTSQDYIKRGIGDLTAEEQRKILVENAVKVFNLQQYVS